MQTCADLENSVTNSFSYSFPAIRGVQAGREYYASMCPLRLLPKLFHFDDEELMPELRAQRSLNKARVPEIARYILENKASYVFSAITASIDGDVSFQPAGDDSLTAFRIGTLTIPMEAKFVINDGQHRRASIEAALASAPELAEETIAVVFFVDRGLHRCQQMFADLNRHAVKPSASLGILYDHRSASARVAKHLSLASPVFRGLIESERSTLSPRSRKLFTLSSLHNAVHELLTDKELEDFPSASQHCQEFWELVSEQIAEWRYVRESKMTSGEVRRDFIHSHAIVLQALGRAGRALYTEHPKEVKKRIKLLASIDWSRTNTQAWEGRAMVGGAMAKSGQNVALTCSEIKRILGLTLTPEEKAAESAYQSARNPAPEGKS
jgi:DNA sulfur modification protein DndB